MTTLVTAVRWGTTTGTLLYAAILRIELWEMLIGVILVAHATLRTFRPVEYRRRGWQSLISILIELAITTGVIVSTGCWDSPFVFALFTPVIAAGFARGFWHAFRIGLTGALTVGTAAFALDVHNGIRPITAWCGELVLTAVVASYGRRLHSRAEEFRALNLSQNWRLNEANGLLVNLNRLAHDLPASFDLTETVERAIAEARNLAPSDVCAVLTLDPVSPLWSVASVEGASLADSYTDEQLPRALRAVARQSLPQLVDGLDAENAGLSASSRSGVYVPLWAGQRQVGLLALESNERAKFGMRHATALRSLSESIALTIDNARWFDRLRARGAAQERNRIARDLHDRVGQEIAYVAFELDRLHGRVATTNGETDDVIRDLGNLRDDTREIVRELRETLYDLRTDVTEKEGITSVIPSFLERVSNRSGIHVVFDDQASRRLPINQEREVWRIAQEAITNAERHADATAIIVSWNVDDNGAELVVSDDGTGMNEQGANGNASTRRPSYGIVGMRERAESIGGLLELIANETSGTVVRLRLGSKRYEQTQHSERGDSPQHV